MNSSAHFAESEKSDRNSFARWHKPKDNPFRRWLPPHSQMPFKAGIQSLHSSCAINCIVPDFSKFFGKLCFLFLALMLSSTAGVRAHPREQFLSFKCNLVSIVSVMNPPSMLSFGLHIDEFSVYLIRLASSSPRRPIKSHVMAKNDRYLSRWSYYSPHFLGNGFSDR